MNLKKSQIIMRQILQNINRRAWFAIKVFKVFIIKTL